MAQIVALKNLPTIPARPVPKNTRVLASGFDTWVESWDAKIHDTIYDQLDAAQALARAAGVADDGRAIIDLGAPDPFEVQPYGGGGAKWIIRNPWMVIEFRSPKMAYATTIRITSAALWQHGIDTMLPEIDDFMAKIADVGEGDPRVQVSRADYAIDFEAPGFTAEMQPEILTRFILPTTTKGHQFFERTKEQTRVETITLGKLPGLQVTIYNKAKEIEHSKKIWMREIWKSESEHVWRYEARFGKEFLKERRCRSRELVQEHIFSMIGGALIDRRLVASDDDATRLRRGDMHYLWGLALSHIGNPETKLACAPFSTLNRIELKAMLAKQVAGLGRAYSVLEHGAFDEKIFLHLLSKSKLIVKRDAAHERKTAAVMDRYRFVDKGV